MLELNRQGNRVGRRGLLGGLSERMNAAGHCGGGFLAKVPSVLHFSHEKFQGSSSAEEQHGRHHLGSGDWAYQTLKFVSALSLDLSVSRTVRNKFLFFVNCQVVGFLLQRHKQNKPHPLPSLRELCFTFPL